VFRGIGKISLLKRLNAVAKKMSEMKALYKSYPLNLKELGKWRRKVESIYKEVNQLTKTQAR
jgi:DNA repair ATPase RecN